MDLDKKIKLDKIMEKTEFSTDVGRKRKFLDKLFLGTRVYFVIRYALIILKMSIKAKKGNYGVEEFKQHSMLVLDLVEDCGGKVKIEGLDNIWACKDEPVVFVGNHMSTLETQLLPLFILPVKNLTFVIKRSLLTFPFFGHIMRATNPIAVTRINPREDLKTVMSETVQVIQDSDHRDKIRHIYSNISREDCSKIQDKNKTKDFNKKLELIKYDNANCLEATFKNEDIVIHCQAYADVQMDLLKEECLKFGVKLNKEQLTLIKEVEDNIVLPTQEELDEAERVHKLNEAYAYLNSTDYKMTVDYFGTLTQEIKDELVTKRAEARELIRSNSGDK